MIKEMETKENCNHEDGFIIEKMNFIHLIAQITLFPSNIELNWLFRNVNTINC